ncbi:MAG: protein kinase [Myxococcota bacterium]
MDGPGAERAPDAPRESRLSPLNFDVLPVRLGPYLLERRLGAGGMGVVFQAQEVDRGRRVAIKLLPALDPDPLARFKSEFRTVADLAHPNLVTLYELQSVDGYWFIAMELVDGSSLRRNLIETGLVPGSEAFSQHVRAAMGQIATGLHALHQAGMLHLDVKPANIMVTRAGRAVLLDFGLVERLGAVEARARRGRVAGTPEYLSPEQARGDAPTAASDWYSLGVTLFEVLTGRLPIVAMDGNATMRKKVAQEAPRAASVARGIPPDLDQLCARLLAREPAERPSWPEIRETLTSGASPLPPAIVREPTLIGRQAELTILTEGLKLSGRGAPVSVYVHGPSGIGKSALLRSFRDHAASQGCLMLQGRCYERETVPFKGLDTIVDALAAHLRTLPPLELDALLPEGLEAAAKLFPVLGGLSLKRVVASELSPTDLRAQAFASLKALFRNVASRERLVVLLDDLQWGDQDSAHLWVELLSPPLAPALLFVGAFRTEESEGPFLSELRRLWDQPQGSALRRVIELMPLSLDEAKDFASSLLGQAGPERAALIAEVSEGSPFLVEQLVLSDTDARAPVDELLGARLSKLEPAAREALTVVSLAGHPLEQRVLERAMGGDPFGPLFALRSARLVRTRGARDRDFIECYHDRIREAVVAGLSPARTKSLHLLIAESLEAAGSASADQLTHHFKEAGEIPRSAKYALVAAEEAWSHLAFDHAAELFELAAQVGDPGGALQARRALALAYAGRGREAADVCLALAKTEQGVPALEWEGKAAEQYLASGHIELGTRLLAELLPQVGLRFPATPRAALIETVLRLVQLRLRGLGYRAREESTIDRRALLRVDLAFTAAKGLIAVDSTRGALFCFLTLLQALRLGEIRRIGRGLALVSGAVLSAAGGSVSRFGQRLLSAAESVASTTGEPYLQGFTAICAGQVRVADGRWHEAVALLEKGLSTLRAENLDFTWECTAGRMGLLRGFEELGRWSRALEEAERLRREAEARGDLYARVTAMLYAGAAYLAADDPQAARQLAEEAERAWDSREFHVQHFYACRLLCAADLYEGQPEAALRRLSGLWPELVGSGLLRVSVMRVDAELLRARVYAAAARPDQLRRSLKALAVERRPDLDAHALAIQGAQGDRTKLEAAASRFGGLGMLADAHVAHLAAGARGPEGLHELGVKAPERWMRARLGLTAPLQNRL